MPDIFAEVSAVGIQGLSGTAAGAGATGATGTAGASGVSGASGVAGASGTGGAGSGATGATGPSGATGIDGASGVGASGVAGASGIGASGSTGLTGASGIAGASGISGASGYVGSDGASGVGATGVAGSSGAVGASGISGASGVGVDGASGVAGATGIAGASGSGNAGASGATGSQGIQGASGVGASGVSVTGASGISGASGYVGSDGATGPSGAAGTTGVIGATGSQGQTGATGVQGSSGVAGASGIGATGTQGASGISGASGVDGTSFTIVGTVAESSLLPDPYSGSIGDGYITEDLGDLWVWDGSAWLDAGPIVGPAGATGTAGATGVRGATGITGASGSTGLTGATGVTGASGIGATGVAGANGASGASGTIGLTGASGTNNLVWGATGQTRTLTGYLEGGTTSTVRTAAITSGVLSLTLASFTPTVGATGLPTSSLNWDVACTGFRATADNPADILDQYVSSVASVAQVSGSVSTTLGDYSAGAYSATPGGGVDWGISYTTNNSTSYIRSTSTTIAGGSASGTVTFNYYNGSAFATWGTTATFATSWATPAHSVSLTSMSGSTFLQTYASTPYTVSGTNITTSANRVFAVTATGGTVSSATSSGTFTFTTAIHKDNTATSRLVTLDTTLTRPIAVTGTSYVVTLGPTNTSNASATFTYPTYWLFTAGVGTAPTRADIINGTGVEAGVTVLSDQVKVLSSSINNSDANPRAFWFAVRASASQPTSFKTGASAGLLSDVAYTDAGNIGLEPDSPPAGYTAENYHLYGFTLQSGSTYVSIS